MLIFNGESEVMELSTSFNHGEIYHDLSSTYRSPFWKYSASALLLLKQRNAESGQRSQDYQQGMSAAAGATETGQLMWPDLRGDGFISSGINQLIWGVLEMMDPQSSPVFPIRSHGHDMDETGGSHILSSWGGF